MPTISSLAPEQKKIRGQTNLKKLRGIGFQDNAVSDFLQKEITGDNLVDTDKFPFWKEDKPLTQKSSDELVKLQEHLLQKYKYWYKRHNKSGLSTYSDVSFRARFFNMKLASRAERNEMIADDFRDHIAEVVKVIRRDFQFRKLAQQQLEAIAIYSTSEYSQMNKLARAGANEQGVASSLHLWLTAKASVAIRRISSQQDVSKYAKSLFVERSSFLNDNMFLQVRRNLFKRKSGAELTNNTSSDEIQKVLSALKFVRRDVNTSWDSDDSKFVGPNFLKPKTKTVTNRSTQQTEKISIYEDRALSSTTTVLEGVSPFNESSSVVLFIEVSPNSPAMYISQLSAYPREEEILWRPGLQFEIVGTLDNRDGTKSSEKELKKLWVFLRPFTQWDIMYYPSGEEVKHWFDNNINGSNIVNTDEFPAWNSDGILSANASVDALKQHLEEKYRYWFKVGTGSTEAKRYTDSEFNIRFNQIKGANLSDRNQMVGEDYRNHINQVVKNLISKDEKIAQYALAIAIYSSSQYGTMNAISRGIPGNNQPINLFFTAKAAVGIRRFGSLRDSEHGTWISKATEHDFRDQLGNVVKRSKVLRRDANLTDDMVKRLITDHYRAGDPENSICQDGALSSSTLNLQGASPFNEGNIVYYIDVTNAELEWAMYIAPYSAYPTEEEVLWLPGMKFKIINVNDQRKHGQKSTTDDNTKLQVYLEPFGRNEVHYNQP